jgi:hypothetical protein
VTVPYTNAEFNVGRILAECELGQTIANIARIRLRELTTQYDQGFMINIASCTSDIAGADVFVIAAFISMDRDLCR